MNSDCAFFIGSDHRICQDYAVAKSLPDQSYVIVADGCSSSPDTDIGARFLVKAAESFLYQIQVGKDPLSSLQRYHEQSVHFAALSSKFLRLDPSCLDATVLTIKANQSGFVASCYGDGVVALVRRDGRLEVFSVEFLEGYPQYVSYLLDSVRRSKFDEQINNHKEVTYQVLPDVEQKLDVKKSSDVIEFYTGTRADYVYVAVFSDGVHSFCEINPETGRPVRDVPMMEIISQLLAFKGAGPCFVMKRMQTFYKMCRERNWRHSDDLSVGVVYLG